MVKQATDWEKIAIYDVTDKALVLRIHKELSQFNNKKTNNKTKNGQKIETLF
jgi:hypothetical protein